MSGQPGHYKFDPWMASEDPVRVANALIVLIQRATALLSRQMEAQEEEFVQSGGIRERMYKARTAVKSEDGAPLCPTCGKAMRKRRSSKGEFWGCTAYPECRGTRDV
jgi:four helix bundle suffix protein